MGENELPILVFKILHPHWMAGLSILLSSVYVFKYTCVAERIVDQRNQMYLLRSLLWLAFSLVWIAFPYIDLVLSRALLRIMIGVIMMTEIAYNFLYIKDAFVGTARWISKK